LLTGALVSGGAAAEATQAIANVRALLGAAGCSLKDVVSISSFVQNKNDFPAAAAAVTAAWVADGLPVSFLIMKGTQVTVACRSLPVGLYILKISFI
jgi:enamine deaminase RidA (YjgF/YER057c/UK114 family)